MPEPESEPELELVPGESAAIFMKAACMFRSSSLPKCTDLAIWPNAKSFDPLKDAPSAEREAPIVPGGCRTYGETGARWVKRADTECSKEFYFTLQEKKSDKTQLGGGKLSEYSHFLVTETKKKDKNCHR